MNFGLKKQIVTTFDSHQVSTGVFGSIASSASVASGVGFGGGGGGGFVDSEITADMISTDSNEYIFDIVSTADRQNIAASSSDNHIYIISTNTFTQVTKIKAHSRRITTLQASSSNPSILYSSSEDNFFKIWDIRDGTKHQAFLNLGSEVNAMAVGMNECLLATSVDDAIRFYDIRAMSSGANCKLGEYSDVHTDIVTQLSFHPHTPNVLVSAAEDGLMGIFDTSVSGGNDAVISILNTECPVRRFGFFGDNSEGIYALSTVETASFWHYPSSQRLSNFTNLRDTFQADYLVDCMTLNGTNDLHIVAGKYSGEAMLLKASPAGVAYASPLVAVAGGHKATLRSSLFLNLGSAQSSIIFTGAEDSIVCAWMVGAGGDSTKNDLKLKKDKHGSGGARMKPF